MSVTESCAPSEAAPANAAGGQIGDSSEIDPSQQSAYLKEAMCHLMSMLAFVQTGLELGGGSGSSSSKASVGKGNRKTGSAAPSAASSLFGSMVPHMYEEAHSAHRRRFADL